jgi:hypothetical protein
MGKQQDPAPDPVAAEAEQGSVIFKVTALWAPERGQSFREVDGGTLEIGEITGRCFNRGQRLELVQVVLQMIREKVETFH